MSEYRKYKIIEEAISIKKVKGSTKNYHDIEKNLFEIRRRNILSEKTQKKKKIEKHIRKKEKEIRKVIRTEKNGTGQEISTLEGKSAPRYEVYKYCKIEGKKERYLIKLCKQRKR